MEERRSENTTLCYIEKENCYLMMHRVKKSHDVNKDKWVGVGGHFEAGESPEECLLREVKEETGLTLDSYRLRGVVTFDSDAWPTEYMFLYTADEFHGTMTECNEGTLEWVPKEEVYDLPIWEGDIFPAVRREGEFLFVEIILSGRYFDPCHIRWDNPIEIKVNYK